MDPRPATTADRAPAGPDRVDGPVAPASTPARAAQTLRDQIVQGRFAPGSRLREEAVAEALRVSRSTIREAFAELAADRLVVREPNRGVFVASLTGADVLDIFGARRAIELGAARGGGSQVIVANVRLAVTDGVQAARDGDGEAAARADQHFHRALVALSASARLNRVIRQLLAELQLVLNAHGVGHALYMPFADDNRRIYDMLAAGDHAGAATALDDTLTRTERAIVAAVLRASS